MQNFGRRVSIGDEARKQTGLASFAKDVYGPLGGDQRLIVRANQRIGAVQQSGLDDLPRLHASEIDGRARIAKSLGGNRVLAVAAM